ncbi:MAG: anti-sigma factor [Planctomycetes bacterium]|nr:anti-sigma factor [Planctomycetota bacterium]
MSGVDPAVERGIEQGERWLRGVMHDEFTVDMRALTARVRLAIEEQRLANRLGVQVPADLTQRCKQRVGRELEAIRRGAPPPRGLWRQAARKPVWPGRSLRMVAAAACLTLVAVGVREVLRTPTPPSMEAADALSAFAKYDDDDLGKSLDALSDDVSALELALGDVMPDELEDALYEELRESVDELETEYGSNDDWS